MLFRTATSVLFYVLITSFVITLHTGLFEDLVQREMCISKHGWKACSSREKIKASNVLVTEKQSINYWERAFEYSSFFPSIATFLVVAGVTDWVENREKIGLYVVTILGCQSLVYMIIMMIHHSRVESLLCGVLLTVLHGHLPGAGIMALVFAVTVTGQDSTRTLLFIFIESMTYIGASFGNLAAAHLPDFISLTYIFVGTFTLCVICFSIVYFCLPSYKSILQRKAELQRQAGGKNLGKEKYGYCKHPFNAIRNEYIAGIILTVGLTELGRRGYNAVIYTFVSMPPISMSIETASIFIFGTGAIQGWVSIFLGIFFVKILYASDNMLAMIALSSAAIWMALTGFAGSETMLYVLSCCLAVFVPLGMASLRSAATKESDVVAGNVIMVLAILGVITMLCRAVTTYNAERLRQANMKISRQLCLLLFAMLQLMAFIVIGSVSLTFNKPIVELRKRDENDNGDDKEQEQETADDQDDQYEVEKKPLLKTKTSFL